MLDALKKYASSWVAQLLIALLVLSFAVWGVSDIFSGFGANSIARVGNVEVPLVEFQRRYDLATQNLSRQLGQEITRAQAVQFGVPNQLLNQLVFEATLDHAASKLGLGISNQKLGEAISKDPSLFGPAGTFDRSYLTQFIRAQRMTEDDFIINRRSQYIRDQLVAALAGGLAAPDAYMRAVHQYSAEQRTISYVVITAPPMSDIADPSETELSTYFDAHKQEWQAPEFRAIDYFTLSPDQIADPTSVTDADARQRYDSQPARFSTPEKRRVEQIVFDNRAEAEPAAAALNAGKKFPEFVAERGLKPADVDLGSVTRDEIIDPAVAEAAFSLPEDGVSPIVDGRFGPVIVHVTKIEPAVVTSFEQARASLKQEIATERAANDVVDLHNAIEDVRAGGVTLAEAGAKYDLKLVTVPAVDSTGKNPAGDAVADLPTGLLAAAFESDVGLENNPIEPDRASWAWYAVTAVTPPRERPLAEVHDRVVTAWKDGEREKKLVAEADTVKARLDAGEAIAAVAADLSLTVETAEKVTRLTAPKNDLSAAVITAAFAGPKGSSDLADGAAPMSRIVFTVDDVTTPPYFSGASDLARADQQISSQIANDLLALYGAQLRSRTDVRLNQVALQQALGVSPN